MTSILCLAHYCDSHGPTPLMVTEGLPVPCSVCYDDELSSMAGSSADKPRTSAVPITGISAHTTTATTAVADALRRIENVEKAQRSPSVSASAVETPPQSPRLPQASSNLQPRLQPHSQSPVPQSKPRHESGYRKTYDEYVTQRAGPCENCALTLPRRQEDDKEDKAVGIDSKPDRGPTLRTRAPCARVYGGFDDMSPLSSQPSSSTPSEDEEGTTHPHPHRHRRLSHRRRGTAVSTMSRSSASSSVRASAHLHYLDYTSTHEPLGLESFSIVRASCLRTLSLETLPRSPAAGTGRGGTSLAAMVAPEAAAGVPNPNNNNVTTSPAYLTTHSAGSAASGGPIFFGDPATGYTTAYIFRIPDVHARGHKRVYAFLALSTHRERLAMKSFSFIAAAFRDMAAWIQALAEAEAEAERTAGSDKMSSVGSSPVVSGPGSGYSSFGSNSGSGALSEYGTASGGVGASSFLTGGLGGLSRRTGPGYSSSGVLLKQRGLAELVGLPDFFIELHTRFVRLLLELGVVLNS